MRNIQKFLPVKNGKFGETMTIEKIAHGNDMGYDAYLQFTGITDSKSNEVYEGAVLELMITDDLMDHNKETFFNSNLGKVVEKDRTIKSIICVLSDKNNTMKCNYDVYFMREDGIKFEEGEPESEAYGSDTLFPTYLCNKGAVVIDYITVNPDILKNITQKSGWATL